MNDIHIDTREVETFILIQMLGHIGGKRIWMTGTAPYK